MVCLGSLRAMNNMFETPRCDTCNSSFKNIAGLDVHMKLLHQETDHERIERRMIMATNAIKQDSKSYQQDHTYKMSTSKIKSYNCVECGLIFSTSDEQIEHEEIHHASEKVEHVGQSPKIFQVTIAPQKGWLSRAT